MTTEETIFAYFNLPRDPSRALVESKEHTREGLARLFGALHFKEGVEVGVWQGEYSQTLCQSSPGLHLFLVDPYVPGVEYGQKFGHEENLRIAKERLANYNVRFIRLPSLSAAANFKDGSLDFVYIDGEHRYEACVADIAAWSPKVRSGGIVAGHDYKKFRRPKPYLSHVIQAVDGWVIAYRINPWFLLSSRDGAKTWFWVKK